MPWSDQTGRVMKKPEEYSKNPNTIRARARKARLDPYTREVEQAKASDSKAITRAWNLHTQSEQYRDATATVRKTMLSEVESEVMKRRRGKGYDAESKIERFFRLNGGNPPGTPSISGSPATLNGYEGPPESHGLMQPIAPMHTLPSRQGGRFATQGSYYGQILPSIEAHRTFTPYGGPGGPQSEVDAASEAASHADPGIRMKRLEAQNQEFKKAIEGLTDELVLAGATLRSQDIRVSQLEDRMQIYHNTASDLYDAETEFARQASKLRSIVFGVKRITEVAAEVYASLANGSPDNLGANNVVDTVRNHQEKVTQNRTGNNTITGMNGINVIVAHSGDAGSDTVNPNNSQVSDTDMTEVEESLDGHNGGAGTVG